MGNGNGKGNALKGPLYSPTGWSICVDSTALAAAPNVSVAAAACGPSRAIWPSDL